MDNKGIFFLVTPLNFERIALKETKEKLELFLNYDLDISDIQIIDGGFELTLPLEVGFKLNNILKTPTKILLRLSTFKCRDFPKLYNKIAKLPWRNYLLGNLPKVEVTSKKSRLINSKRIEETCDKGIKKYYQANPPKQHDETVFYRANLIINLRIINDVVTVSIDTSGTKLYLRGDNKLVGEAPMRETIAAAVMTHYKDELDNIDTIVDPMCGSGTILIEALDYFKEAAREFSYEFFPIYKKLPSIELQSVEKFLFDKYYGFDSNLKMTEMAQSNAHDRIRISKRDATEIHEESPNHCFILINPPYGQRLIPDSKLDQFYNKIINGVVKSYLPELLIMIVPRTIKVDQIAKISGYEISNGLKFKNGGFNVKLLEIKKCVHT